MKWMLTLALAGALAGTLAADDKYKVKAEAKDPVTGEKVKSKTKVKSDKDGDYKEESKTKVNGHTVEKHKEKVKTDK